jgi:hypothetical protein
MSVYYGDKPLYYGFITGMNPYTTINQIEICSVALYGRTLEIKIV